MKVLYFHQHFSTPNGAAGIRSYEMAQRLLARGHQVTMVCGSYGGADTGLTGTFSKGCRRGSVDGIHVIEFDLSYANTDGFLKRAIIFMQYALRSVVLVFTESYDVLFATSTPLTAGIPGIFARWLRRKPFIFEVRDLWPELPKAMAVIRNRYILWLLSLLEWLSYRSAHRLIGLSPGIVEGIAKRGIEPNKITLIPNACDLDIFGPLVDAWRPAEVNANDLLAVFAGTHGMANGLDAVLDAAMELKKRGRKDIKLLLIGQGKLKPALQARARAEQLDNVLFYAPLNKINLAKLFAGADIGLQILANVPAFYYGTSPNKFFDYISAGLPVLNNYPGWVSDMIKKERCGFAIEPNNPVVFADALELAAKDSAVLKEMGENSRRLAEREFNRRVLAERFVDWLEAVAR